MAHRLVLGFDAVADNITPTQVVERIVATWHRATEGAMPTFSDAVAVESGIETI